MILGVALFGLVHSALAGTRAKEAATALVGERLADGLYRPFYNAVSLAFVAGLIVYIRRQPVHDIYRAEGPLAWVLRLGQAAALAFLLWGSWHVGPAFFAGWDNAAAWWHGAAELPPPPVGLGPAPAGDAMRATGPFASTRHPLNWGLLPLFWLTPRLTTRRLAFNAAVTAYVVLGSWHAERHMLDAYGAAYQRYKESVPFFVG